MASDPDRGREGKRFEMNQLSKPLKGSSAVREVELRHRFRVGDRVQIVDIPSDLKDPRKKDNALRTGHLFRFCLGRKFRIEGFDRHGFPELQVSGDPQVAKSFGKFHSIWIDPRSLKLLRQRNGRVHRASGLGWKITFRKSELEWTRSQRNLSQLKGTLTSHC